MTVICFCKPKFISPEPFRLKASLSNMITKYKINNEVSISVSIRSLDGAISSFLTHAAVRVAKVDLVGHIDKQACLDNTRNELQLRVYFLPVVRLLNRKDPVENEVVVVGDDGTRFVDAHSQVHLATELLLDSSTDGRVAAQFRYHFDRDAFVPVLAQVGRVLAVVGDDDELFGGRRHDLLLRVAAPAALNQR